MGEETDGASSDALRERRRRTAEEEFSSFVRHELYNQLTIVCEALSQVLEGLCDNDAGKRNEILGYAMGSTHKVNELIKELVTAVAYHKAVKAPDSSGHTDSSPRVPDTDKD